MRNYCNPNDPRVAGESFVHLKGRMMETPAPGESMMVMDTVSSGLSVCTYVKNICSVPAKMTCHANDYHVSWEIGTSIQQGQTVTLTKYTIYTDSVRYEDCCAGARRVMEEAVSVPLQQWYDWQKDYLDVFWNQSALDIEGDDDLALAVRYNLYQLIQSAARENARILGHKKGALYPWRTISGKECSGYFPSGSAQYHIDGDIAYAVVAYYLATLDLDYIAQKGAEIVFETARLWMDAGNFHKGRFLINAVTGPDEYTCIVNNNYYTNACAQYNLHWAVRFWALLEEAGQLAPVAEKIGLTREEILGFEQAEKAMYLPYDEELGINPQDDSFLQKEKWDIANTPKDHFPLLLHYHPLYIYRFQVCKQADTVLAHFIFEDAQDLETIRRSFAYYETVTTHDSSLSTCIYSIVASKLGEREKAYQYFGDSAKLDLFNLHHNTKDGIHTANMGGNYMAVVYGFGGLRLKEDGLHLAPYLPGPWKAYTFKVHYRGRNIKVCVDENKTTVLLESGDAVPLWIYGKKTVLENTLEFSAQQ